MDLKRLRYFCTIIEQKSISGAARKLFIAQPPLSKRLQELEEEIGTPLIIRAGKQFAPTEAGLFLYQRACEVLRNVDELRLGTIAVAASQRRVLRVGVSYLFSHFFFPLVRELHVRNQRSEISVTNSDSSHLEHLLQNGDIEIALLQRPKEADAFDIVDFPLLGMKALISKSLRGKLHGDPVKLGEIGDSPLILLRRVAGAGTFEAILDALRRAGNQPNVKMYVSNPTVAIEMLESGVEAVVFLPASEAMPSPSGMFDVVNVFPSPLVFAPVMARLSISVDIPELTEIARDFSLRLS